MWRILKYSSQESLVTGIYIYKLNSYMYAHTLELTRAFIIVVVFFVVFVFVFFFVFFVFR